MAAHSDDIAAPDLVANLKDVLLELAANSYPEVANPPGVRRRASVALIIRIQPHYRYWPTGHQHSGSDAYRGHLAAAGGGIGSTKDALEEFFSQKWVKHGDPEVLFIRRAERKRDPWTGHIALPGGRRDPEDRNDEAAAVREAMEEVGIDLSRNHALTVGNLPATVVAADWGKRPYASFLRAPLDPEIC
jgi:8-oxo-dGTP pyrophosphatase MutT (NUDIX family)